MLWILPWNVLLSFVLSTGGNEPKSEATPVLVNLIPAPAAVMVPIHLKVYFSFAEDSAVSPVTPPLLPQPQSCAELYWDLLSRSKAFLTLSFSGIWLPLEDSCAARTAGPRQGPVPGEGRRKPLPSVQHKANLGSSSLLVPLSQKSCAGLSCVQVSVPKACIWQ